MSEVARRLQVVREEIARAAERAGRDPAAVTLVAVSKSVPVSRMREAVEAGQRDFGENRAREAAAKSAELEGVRWHFVGRLQRNKVRRLLGFVDVIHSVDRVELAAEIDATAGRPVEVLVEVNVSGEATKGGVKPAGLTSLLEQVSVMPNVRVSGLMTIAPQVADPEDARQCFRTLARLLEGARDRFPGMDIRHLSMGMSQDYAVAVEEGATMVRIGEAIFGVRGRQQPAPVGPDEA